MACVKRLGQGLTSRDLERQVAEIHTRVASLNRFTAIGRPQTVAVGSICPGQGEIPPKSALCNKAVAMGKRPKFIDPMFSEHISGDSSMHVSIAFLEEQWTPRDRCLEG